MRKVVIVYSEDRALSAEVLGKALAHSRHTDAEVEYRKAEGRNLLEFWLDGIIRYREDEYPLLVAELLEPSDPCEWRDPCGGTI